MNNSLSEVKQDKAVQDIQGMIAELLTNAVDKMQKTEYTGDDSELTPEMSLTEVKSFVSAMQKFIDRLREVI